MEFKWVTLEVSDYQKSRQFYHKVLGLEIADEISHGPMQICFLGGSDQPKIEIIGVTGPAEERGKGVSIGLAVDGLTELLERLKALPDCQVTGPVSPNPQAVFYFATDPDGYKIQLMEK